MQIAFYKGKTRLFNRLTSWWLRGPYSHCELVLGTSQIGQAICASSSFLDHGVRVKHMTLKPEHWDLVDVAGDVGEAWAWIRAHEGQGYDLLGLAGFVLRVLGHDQTRWVCSEAVAAMLRRPDAWRFDPCTLWAAYAPLVDLEPEAVGP
ncbi:hypothetical protein [Acidovorax sp. Root219]|uniref:hypothetical protein n=1 Tax=Acidovorax sp. Root219 TaxID=1736493 RepID=UPI00070A1F23|nr:hypothetical protein [Acidovorax sp. Root219]KRC36226.1 hypothetical protein ASE28_01445 [Acidovorax sp. Root219]